MTEKEYIQATNLAKIRIAERAIRDMVPLDGSADVEKYQALARLVHEVSDDVYERLDKLMIQGDDNAESTD